MVQKRRYDDDEVLEVSSKLPRQLGHSNQLVSFSESVFPEDSPQFPHKLEGGFRKGNAEVDEKLSNDIFTELPRSAEDTEASVPGCISISSWATSSTSEEDFWLGAPVHGSCFPDYFHSERPTRTLSHCKDIYSILLDGPPRKFVPIGPNYQADIPACGSQGTKNASNHLDSSEAISHSNPIIGDEDEKRLMGTCVIPMPDLELSSCNGVKVGNGRIDCSCEDGGSVRCVRQHIMEAREKLLKNIGLERFVELGFYDMGEHVVAQKWNEEEEHLFNEIVFSNPASLGKNFWKNLSIVFPSRTKREIVSYYFNVFMFRRRAEQNRCVPTNIDSDNDEWQGSDDYGDNELGMTEEDEDSVVESPLYHDDPGFDRSREDDLQENDKDAADETCDNNVDIASGEGVTNISETNPKKLLNNCGSSPSILLQYKTPWDERGDGEVQDDLRTSSDTGVASQATEVKSANGNHWPSSINGLSSGVGHEYMVEPCDSKVWDARFLPCPKNKVDLLPTCSMIEEIFGDGSWNHKARDGQSLS